LPRPRLKLPNDVRGFIRRNIYRSFQAFRREFKEPRKNERNRKSERNKNHDQAHYAVRNLEHRENLRDPLSQRPSHESVRNRNSVNFAPLQFGKQTTRFHLEEMADFEL
jgi:hypothetical protein